MSLRLLIIASFTLVLCACSVFKDKNYVKPNELVDFDATWSIKKDWSKNTGSGIKKKLYSRLEPAVSGAMIYATDYEGQVSAYGFPNTESETEVSELKIRKGRLIWNARLKEKVSAGVAADKFNVYVVTLNAELIALDRFSGEERWRFALSSEGTSIPASDSSTVVATSIDGGVYAIDAESGRQIWDYRHPVPLLTFRSAASPVIVASEVLVAFDSGQIKSMALADGITNWEVRVTQPKGRTDLERVVDIDGTPIIDGGSLYAATVQGAIAAFDRSNGRAVWRQQFSTADQLALGEDRLYGVTPLGEVVAHDAYTGALLWKNEDLLRRGVESPVAVGEHVAVIDQKGYLHLMDGENGDFLARIRAADKGFGSRLSVVNEQLIVLGADGKLAVYQVESKGNKVSKTEEDAPDIDDESDSSVEFSIDEMLNGSEDTSPEVEFDLDE